MNLDKRLTEATKKVARLEAANAAMAVALAQLINVAKGIAHCYDELDEDERRELQQVCAESEAILLSPDAGKGSSDMTLAQAKEALHSALDGLGIAQDREEHMGSDKIHGAYCLNCLELSRRWQDWQGAGGTKEASPRG